MKAKINKKITELHVGSKKLIEFKYLNVGKEVKEPIYLKNKENRVFQFCGPCFDGSEYYNRLKKNKVTDIIESQRDIHIRLAPRDKFKVDPNKIYISKKLSFEISPVDVIRITEDLVAL